MTASLEIPTRLRISPTRLFVVESMAATRCNGSTISWCSSFASLLALANVSPSAGEHSMSAEYATGLACGDRRSHPAGDRPSHPICLRQLAETAVDFCL